MGLQHCFILASFNSNSKFNFILIIYPNPSGMLMLHRIPFNNLYIVVEWRRTNTKERRLQGTNETKQRKPKLWKRIPWKSIEVLFHRHNKKKKHLQPTANQKMPTNMGERTRTNIIMCGGRDRVLKAVSKQATQNVAAFYFLFYFIAFRMRI